MAAPEVKPNFCGGVGFDGPDWPGPWGCGGVMREVVGGVETTHLCALSYDHVDYQDEPHVCVLGHRWDVWTPRRRWWQWMLRRSAPQLPQRREPFGSFWDELNRRMEDPDFRRAYEKQSALLNPPNDDPGYGTV